MKFIAMIRAFFLKKDGGKEVIDRTRLFGTMIIAVGVGVSAIIFSENGGDSSVVVNATEPIEVVNFAKKKAEVSSPKVSGLLQVSEQHRQVASPKKQVKPAPKQKIKYRAPQVIERQDSFTSKLPLGSNLIGKLLTAVDTRESEQLYKVLLPYGGKGKHGGIPKNTVLFGTVNYPNKGRKVFMQFSKALLPDGREVELKAQALNAKDYSPGLEGKLHSGTTVRVAATLGLTMVSAFTDTLTEKQVLGSEGQVAPKATVKDAMYQGIAKASEAEAQRQAAELSNVQAYVTVPAGREIIVNLLASYRGGARKRQTSLMSGANDE